MELSPDTERQLAMVGIMVPATSRWNKLNYKIEKPEDALVYAQCETDGCFREQMQLWPITMDGRKVWVGQCLICLTISWAETN
jgi:hypothetical protein